MKFSVGGLFGKKNAPAGPMVVGRTEFGGEFSIGYNESFVIEDVILTSHGVVGNKLDLELKAGDRSGRVDVPVKDVGSPEGCWWYEYMVRLGSIDPASKRASVSVKKAVQGAKPMTYDSDFWLKPGECAVFEQGFMVRNKSTSRSNQGEFTNVTLGLEYRGQKGEVTLVSFAKGKEKFVYAQMKNAANFGPFDIKLNGASENEAAINVHRSNELML